MLGAEGKKKQFVKGHFLFSFLLCAIVRDFRSGVTRRDHQGVLDLTRWVSYRYRRHEPTWIWSIQDYLLLGWIDLLSYCAILFMIYEVQGIQGIPFPSSVWFTNVSNWNFLTIIHHFSNNFFLVWFTPKWALEIWQELCPLLTAILFSKPLFMKDCNLQKTNQTSKEVWFKALYPGSKYSCIYSDNGMCN